MATRSGLLGEALMTGARRQDGDVAGRNSISRPLEDEFGAAHTRCCGARVVVHDVDQRLQRIPVTLLRRLGQGRFQFSSELVGRGRGMRPSLA
jgi:hypothetical protein